MICMPAWRYGAALSATAGLLYLACALVAMAVPDVIARSVAAIVHGLNIGSLTASAPSTSLPTALGGLLFVVLYAFVAGWLFGALRNSFARAGAQ